MLGNWKHMHCWDVQRLVDWSREPCRVLEQTPKLWVSVKSQGFLSEVWGSPKPVSSGGFSYITLRSALRKDKTTPCGWILGSFLCKTAFLWEAVQMPGLADLALYLTCIFLNLHLWFFFFLSCRSLSPFYKAWLLLPKSAPWIVTTLNTPSW